MSDERSAPTTRDTGAKHQGDARTSPYPVSRLAPVHDLVDVARQISEADLMLGVVASAELTQIAEQIKSLQERARTILDEAKASLDLHRARCSFQKRPGHVYHLYGRETGERWLSMIGPSEWADSVTSSPSERVFLGSYRLELDQSWTRVDTADAREAVVAVRASELVQRMLTSGR